MVLVVGKDGDSLKKLAYDYLGDFELWQIIADQNNIDAFTDLFNLEIDIPDIDNIEDEVTVTLPEFENLTDIIKTANNWQSLEWV